MQTFWQIAKNHKRFVPFALSEWKFKIIDELVICRFLSFEEFFIYNIIGHFGADLTTFEVGALVKIKELVQAFWFRGGGIFRKTTETSKYLLGPVKSEQPFQPIQHVLPVTLNEKGIRRSHCWNVIVSSHEKVHSPINILSLDNKMYFFSNSENKKTILIDLFIEIFL